jgi:hypothetical protein
MFCKVPRIAVRRSISIWPQVTRKLRTAQLRQAFAVRFAQIKGTNAAQDAGCDWRASVLKDTT